MSSLALSYRILTEMLFFLLWKDFLSSEESTKLSDFNARIFQFVKVNFLLPLVQYFLYGVCVKSCLHFGLLQIWSLLLMINRKFQIICSPFLCRGCLCVIKLQSANELNMRGFFLLLLSNSFEPCQSSDSIKKVGVNEKHQSRLLYTLGKLHHNIMWPYNNPPCRFFVFWIRNLPIFCTI